MKHLSTALVAGVVLGLLVSMAGANDFPSLREGSDQPIDISSKKLFARSTSAGAEARFDGNVRVTQGDWTLTCDKLTLHNELKRSGERAPGKQPPKNLETTGTLKSVTAVGNVTFAQRNVKAVAGQALFDNAKRIITLTGRPQIGQGLDTVAADTIVFYLDENRYEALGKDGRPIKVTINSVQQKER